VDLHFPLLRGTIPSPRELSKTVRKMQSRHNWNYLMSSERSQSLQVFLESMGHACGPLHLILMLVSCPNSWLTR